MASPRGDMRHQELLAGLIRLHILHHAAQGELYGRWMIEELGRHGYRLSPGTLYPMLHGMERKGYLASRAVQAGRSARRLYRATPMGRKALNEARRNVRELFAELLPPSKLEKADAWRGTKPSRPAGSRRG